MNRLFDVYSLEVVLCQVVGLNGSASEKRRANYLVEKFKIK